MIYYNMIIQLLLVEEKNYLYDTLATYNKSLCVSFIMPNFEKGSYI